MQGGVEEDMEAVIEGCVLSMEEDREPYKSIKK